MCLEIIVQIPKEKKDRADVKRFSEISGLHISKVTYNTEPALHFSVNGGCSCDFLDDNADWDSSVWMLLKEELPRLEKAMVVIGNDFNKFRFLAHWLDGKVPEQNLKTTLKNLLTDIRSNRIKNNVMYLIGFGR